MLAACDTFRAAAIEQLKLWGQRLKVEVIAGTYGADAASVAHDAVTAAQARKADYLFIDTAGRLHTKHNLMQELQKLHRVIGKQLPGAPHEVLLVLDATTGMNALNQAREFNKAVPLTGLIVTKLDGTSKGGMVVAIQKELACPSNSSASASSRTICSRSMPPSSPRPCSNKKCPGHTQPGPPPNRGLCAWPCSWPGAAAEPPRPTPWSERCW